VLPDPREDWGKPEFVPVHRAADEFVSGRALDFKVETVTPQEDIDGGESDALVAIKKSVIVVERLHQRGRLLF
jgi:hypothetical protein